MAKYKKWINLYKNGDLCIYHAEMDAHRAAVLLPERQGQLVETREIEWETKEPTRVADYLVEITNPTPLYHLPFTHWLKQTHPIGSQPEGSVMVPNSEREVSE